MVSSSGERCAGLARALDEPLAGTAPFAPRWVGLEHRGAWPRDVGAHADPLVAAFVTRAVAAGWRPVLIRPPGRRAETSSARVLWADTSPASPRITGCTVDGPSELAGVALPAPGRPLPGTAVLDPLLLVCTHGRRDRCCALDGRALVAALTAAGEPGVWECSHLGGHRFAPTALLLPTGYLYGRLDPAIAVAVRKAASLGEVETARCRGRSTWTPAGQVAELAVRASTGLRDADALTVTGEAAVTVVARDGRHWAVDVRTEPGPERPASCGAAPTRSAPLRATEVRPLP